MMRRLSVVLTVVALVAVMATSAFAQPTIGGLVRFQPTINLDDDFAISNPTVLAIINVSGNASDNVSYYARLQGSSAYTDYQPRMALAYIDVKNLFGEGSYVRMGRQGLPAGPTNSIFGLNGDTQDGLRLTLNPSDGISVTAYADTTFEDLFAGQATVDLGVGTVGVNFRSEPGAERETGFTFQGDFGFDGVGTLYGEVGKEPGEEDMNIKIVGVSVDPIKDAIGWDNWFEYDIENSSWALGLSKTFDNKLLTRFELKDAETLSVRFQVGF